MTKFSNIADISKTEEKKKALDKVIRNIYWKNINLELRECWNSKAKGYSEYIKVFGLDWVASTFGDKIEMSKESKI